jgi:hypothetical protein
MFIRWFWFVFSDVGISYPSYSQMDFFCFFICFRCLFFSLLFSWFYKMYLKKWLQKKRRDHHRNISMLCDEKAPSVWWFLKLAMANKSESRLSCLNIQINISKSSSEISELYRLHNQPTCIRNADWLNLILAHVNIKFTSSIELPTNVKICCKQILIYVIFRPGICKNTFLCSVLHWRIIIIKRFFSGVRARVQTSFGFVYASILIKYN